MKNWQRNILFLLSTLPLLLKYQYMSTAWHYSPLERGGWILWLCVPISILICEFTRQSIHPAKQAFPSWKSYAGLLLLCLVGWGFCQSPIYKVNAFAILLGIAILYLASGLRFGRELYVFQLPSLVFALLGTPSVFYWLTYYLDGNLSGAISQLSAKILLGTLFLSVWCLVIFKKKSPPKLQSLVFILAACAVFLFAQVQHKSIPNGAPLLLDTQKLTEGDWAGKMTPTSQSDLDFFTGCTQINRLTYFNSNSSVYLLALEVVDITNLHPMAICSESSGMSVLSSKQIYLNLKQGQVQVNELLLEHNGIKNYAYSIYSNDTFSTGDFAKFRLLRKDKKVWQHYQLLTPATPDEATARARIESFLNAFSKSVSSPSNTDSRHS